MFSFRFKERHPTLFCLLAGFGISFFALWLYFSGIALFIRALRGLKEALYSKPRDYIILFFPDEEKKQKPGGKP